MTNNKQTNQEEKENKTNTQRIETLCDQLYQRITLNAIKNLTDSLPYHVVDCMLRYLSVASISVLVVMVKVMVLMEQLGVMVVVVVVLAVMEKVDWSNVEQFCGYNASSFYYLLLIQFSQSLLALTTSISQGRKGG